MTNREWLNTLTDEEFVRMMWCSCECCVAQGNMKECRKQASCNEGRLRWLKKEHEESDNDK